jgi:hypothetical protein
LPPEDVLEFGALGDEDAPSAQIDAIQEQLSSIKFESGRDADAGGDGRAADDEVDFSLPEDEWPEVEVVLRAAPSSHAGDYEEEEVVADPFQTAPAAHAPTWAPSRRAAVTEVAGVPAGIPTDKADQVRERDVPPLQSVPLMAHVETNLYTPDPIWPDEQLSTASIVLPTNGAADAILGTVGGWDRASQELAADIATTPRMPVQAPPSAKRRPTTPAQKKFGALFTSLQD